MKIIFLLALAIFLLFFMGRKAILSATRTLFKDQSAWAGKDIKIKRRKTNKDISSASQENYLKIIADESKSYLDEKFEKQ